MTTVLMPVPKQQYFNSTNQRFLAGGKLYTYAAGTTTPKATYTDSAGATPQTNPIILNARGEPDSPIYWDGSYKVILKDSNDSTIYTVDNYKSDPFGVVAFIANLAASAGASLIGFLQSGVGAVLRTVQSKLRDTVSVKDFGAVGDGVADDTAAIQAAITYAASGNPKTVYFPNGVYLTSSSLTIPSSGSGVALSGESPNGCYLRTSSGTFDILRVAASYVNISGLLFRPGGNQLCIRIYAAHCIVRNNRFLAATDNVGTAILATDVDPDTSSVIAGAYSHTFDSNVIGVTGFAFAIGIDCSSTNGMQAMTFRNDQILSDRCIVMPKGGGNSYQEKLLQSSTGGGVGIGIDLGADASGETIIDGYFEGFLHGILLRNLSNANQVADANGHFDACTNKLTTLGTANYVFRDDAGTNTTRGWVNNYTSGSVNRWLTPSGSDVFAIDSSAHLLVNATSGTSHTINTTGAGQNDVILSVNGAGNSMSYFQHATGASPNGANTGFAVKTNSVTGRSINAGGTVNASGADYAEYMRKAQGCGVIAKGQIVGINSNGEITDQWAASLTFATKSTDPSYVGGDGWFTTPRPQAPTSEDGADAFAQYEQDMAVWEAEHEAARQCMDRIAFAGQVPVNVLGAQPGQYIVPVQDGDGIKGVPMNTADMTLADYMRSIGIVIAIEPDGRARIIVKVS